MTGYEYYIEDEDVYDNYQEADGRSNSFTIPKATMML